MTARQDLVDMILRHLNVFYFQYTIELLICYLETPLFYLHIFP